MLRAHARLPVALGAAALVAGVTLAWAQAGGTQDRPIVGRFDVDKNGRLDASEREAAKAYLARLPANRRVTPRATRPPAEPGVPLTAADVANVAGKPLYDAATLRTFFLEFDQPDWEAEMVAFNNTDVDLPATVTVDGVVYRDVGVHFRGNSSFGVGDGYKRSLNLTFDFVHRDQAIDGYQTLNFLNANADPTFLRTVVSMHIARQFIPAPKANLVRVVINGENWGVYTNAQQFDKQFLRDNFNTTKGTRWKVPQGGFGGGGGGFTYRGDNPNSYRGVYNIKSKDEQAAWTALINLTRVLQQTPPEALEAALEPMLDIDGLLRFLALDAAMASDDGFYQRVADYSLYLDPQGRFHLTFHDTNEMFDAGAGQDAGDDSTFLDPLVSADDPNKPIISKVLAVPALRARYVEYVRQIADRWFDWKTIGPVIEQHRDLIADDVARDTRKLSTFEEFLRGTTDAPASGSLRSFLDQRRVFLLRWARQQQAAPQRP